MQSSFGTALKSGFGLSASAKGVTSFDGRV